MNNQGEEEWFPDFSMYQNALEGWKIIFRLYLRIYDLVDLGWGTTILSF